MNIMFIATDGVLPGDPFKPATITTPHLPSDRGLFRVARLLSISFGSGEL
jgi:hypothetical protein